MRFIPEQCSIKYSHQYGKAAASVSGRWPLENSDLSLNFEEERRDEVPGYRFSLRAKKSLYVHRISLSGRIEGTLRPISLRKEGYQSWSFSDILDPDSRQQKPLFPFITVSQESPWNPPSGKAGEHTSDTLALLDDGLSESLLLAQQAPFSEYVAFAIDTHHQPVRVTISWVLQRELNAQEEYATSRLEQSEGTAEELLYSWSTAVSEVLENDGLLTSPPPTGWCSWYEFFTAITPEKIRSNLAVAGKASLPFEVFQIDDGWQRTIGDWTEPNEAFTGQMPALAKEISTAGFVPGLWLAPFIISRDSEHFRKPGWVLKTEKGKPVVAGYNRSWKGKYYALDCTNPEVGEYLDQVMRTVVQEWGYRYLKLDFLFAASLPGKRFDNRLSSAQVLSESLKRMRRAAGEGVRFMGCGLPLAAGAGNVEAARVSCDVAPRWGQSRGARFLRSDSNLETRGAIRNSILRSHLNKTFWHNDPDCLMLRKRNTSLTEGERDTLRTSSLYCGGSLFVSDDLSAYDEDELNLLRETFQEGRELQKGRTLPLRIFDDRGVYTLYNDQGYIVLFNLNDTETTIEFRLSSFRDLLVPYTSYRPFDGAEDHPLEAPRNIQLPARGYKRIALSKT